MKTTRRYAAGLAAIVTTTAGLLAGTGLVAGAASAGSLPAFVGPLHHVTTLAVTRGGHLSNPLGLVVAPGGDILTVNSGNGNLVEITPSGFQIAVRTLDSSGSPPGAGALFGLAVKPGHRAVYFVDDATNTFALLH